MEAATQQGAVIIPPVFIHPTAEVINSVVGPHVSLGAGSRVERSILSNSILEDEAQVLDVILESSLIGRRAHIQRRAGVINAGDQTSVIL
jgi:glucose-1-phosphate thymidylyltransferase